MRSLYQFLLLILLCSSFSSFAQVPLYDSYPSANATIFLDFDGHYVVGTAWNTNGPISGAPANLNATQIIEVCNRVAEDYRPFNINVTTDSTKYWAAPADQRIRVILTTTSDWYSPAGGVSFINSFTWGDHTPAFVFTSLLNFKPKNIAEAASHEAGHTLGLRHQSVYDNICNKTAEYNPGNGTGEIGWAPIMGVGYYKNVTTWHNGPASSGCNVAQDDLAIITGTVNGFGYRPTGREGSSFGSATSLTIQENKFEANGIVVTRTDYYYKISLGVMSPVKI